MNHSLEKVSRHASVRRWWLLAGCVMLSTIGFGWLIASGAPLVTVLLLLVVLACPLAVAFAWWEGCR